MKKAEAEEYLGRTLNWCEFSKDREFIAGDRIVKSPIVVVSREQNTVPVTSMTPQNNKPQTYIKCRGTHGSLIPSTNWDEEDPCLKCLMENPIGELPETYNTESRFEKIGPLYFSFDRTARCVPWCPHSIEGTSKLKGLNKVSCVERIGKSVIREPISWKITANENKINLAVQVRERFVTPEKGIAKGESLYQNVTVDLSTGRTYVSDLHSEIRHVKTSPVSKATMEEITYADSSELLYYEDSLEEAFATFTDVVISRIRKQGIEPELTYMHRCNSQTYHTIPQQLKFIAWINRFPYLQGNPAAVLREVLPKQATRRLSALKRNIRPEEIGTELGFTDTRINNVIATNPTYAACAVALNQIGYDEDDIATVLIDNKTRKALTNSLTECASMIGEYECPLDAYEIFLADWLLCSNGLKEAIINANKYIGRGGGHQYLSTSHSDEEVPASAKDWTMSFQKNKANWTITYNPATYLTHQQCQFKKDGQFAGYINVVSRVLLDRRKWKKTKSKQLVSAAKQKDKKAVEALYAEWQKMLRHAWRIKNVYPSYTVDEELFHSAIAAFAIKNDIAFSTNMRIAFPNEYAKYKASAKAKTKRAKKKENNKQKTRERISKCSKTIVHR